MVDTIRTGSTVVPALRGKESFDYFAGEPELAELFNQTMTSVSELTDGTVVAGYDFSVYPTIVDVGGGHGPLLAAILAGAQALRGVLYDLPRVVSGCHFGFYPTIVDVGGGHGPLLDAILAGAQASRGVLYDLPQVVADA